MKDPRKKVSCLCYFRTFRTTSQSRLQCVLVADFGNFIDEYHAHIKISDIHGTADSRLIGFVVGTDLCEGIYDGSLCICWGMHETDFVCF